MSVQLFGITIETDNDNVFNLIPDAQAFEKGAKQFQIKATPDMIRRFLFKTKPGDNVKMAKSIRFFKYDDLVDFIIKGTYNKFWFWSNVYPKTQEEFENICYRRKK